MKVVKNALELIGNTPLLKLERVTKGLDVNVYVKCEYLNPSGSIKDRMALRMVEEAEKEGKLKPGGTIVESTGGNTGPALAFVGAVKGYNVRLFIPAEWTGTYAPTDRVNIMKFFGAEVETFDPKEYRDILNKIDEEYRTLASVCTGFKKCYDLDEGDPDIFWTNQSCNINNAGGNEETGKEIIKQLEGKVDAWVASIGTGGTFLGVAEAVKKENQDVMTIGVQPEDAPIMELTRAGLLKRIFELFGMEKMKLLTEIILEKGMPDKLVTVSNKDAVDMAYRLCMEEGLFCGMSSGANVYAAIQVAKDLGKDANVVTVLVDRRDRYFSEHPNEHYII